MLRYMIDASQRRLFDRLRNPMKLNDIIETTEAEMTNIYITETFEGESCDWCEKPVGELAGRYVFNEGCGSELVTICIHCLNQEEIS